MLQAPQGRQQNLSTKLELVPATADADAEACATPSTAMASSSEAPDGSAKTPFTIAPGSSRERMTELRRWSASNWATTTLAASIDSGVRSHTSPGAKASNPQVFESP